MNKIQLFIFKQDGSNEIIDCEHFTLCACGDIRITKYEENEKIEIVIGNEEYEYFGAWGK